MTDIRTGFGLDVHRFQPGRELWLCGVSIPDAPVGLLGHSDADVALHALCDALLGAAGLRDIGYYFPDTDAAYEGADSKKLLARVLELIDGKGWRLGNADITICAQTPKLAPFIERMRSCVAAIAGVETDAVAVKATTSEHLGFTGRKEGIAAFANVLIFKKHHEN